MSDNWRAIGTIIIWGVGNLALLLYIRFGGGKCPPAEKREDES